MKLIAKNITLENIKKSNYWELIAILIWNHYRDKEEQDESKITFIESWYGEGKCCSSHGIFWDDPNYSDPDYVRTLGAIVIKFERTDYITYIYIHTDGNINCVGKYCNGENETPSYRGNKRNLDITNWLLANNMLDFQPV